MYSALIAALTVINLQPLIKPIWDEQSRPHVLQIYAVGVVEVVLTEGRAFLARRFFAQSKRRSSNWFTAL